MKYFFLLIIQYFVHTNYFAEILIVFAFPVEALKGIATKLNKTDWDFSVDPCSASGNWANSTGFIISNVTCDCSFKNNTECHIVRL